MTKWQELMDQGWQFDAPSDESGAQGADRWYNWKTNEYRYSAPLSGKPDDAGWDPYSPNAQAIFDRHEPIGDYVWDPGQNRYVVDASLWGGGMGQGGLLRPGEQNTGGNGWLGGLSEMISSVPVLGNIADETDRTLYNTLGKASEGLGITSDQQSFYDLVHMAGIVAATAGAGGAVAGGAGVAGEGAAGGAAVAGGAEGGYTAAELAALAGTEGAPGYVSGGLGAGEAAAGAGAAESIYPATAGADPYAASLANQAAPGSLVSVEGGTAAAAGAGGTSGLLSGGGGAAAGGGLSSLFNGNTVPALTSLGGSLLAADANRSATNSAIDAQNAATDKSLALTEKMFNKGIELNQPFYDAGKANLPSLVSAITGQPYQGVSYDYKSSPVANEAIKRGGVDLMRSLGARGLAGSGGASTKLADLTSGIYANDYDKQISRLSGLVGLGTSSANTLTNLGTSNATNQSNIINAAGANNANAALAEGKNNASLYQGIGNIPLNLAYLNAISNGKWNMGP